VEMALNNFVFWSTQVWRFIKQFCFLINTRGDALNNFVFWSVQVWRWHEIILFSYLLLLLSVILLCLLHLLFPFCLSVITFFRFFSYFSVSSCSSSLFFSVTTPPHSWIRGLEHNLVRTESGYRRNLYGCLMDFWKESKKQEMK
jgi:hypothetical protein